MQSKICSKCFHVMSCVDGTWICSGCGQKDTFVTDNRIDSMINEIIDNNDKLFPEWRDLSNPLMHNYWTNALSGEAGELSNLSKKLARYYLKMNGKTLSLEQYKELAELEIGDIFIYCVLYSDILGLNFNKLVRKTLEKNYSRFGWKG